MEITPEGRARVESVGFAVRLGEILMACCQDGALPEKLSGEAAVILIAWASIARRCGEVTGQGQGGQLTPRGVPRVGPRHGLNVMT